MALDTILTLALAAMALAWPVALVVELIQSVRRRRYEAATAPSPEAVDATLERIRRAVDAMPPRRPSRPYVDPDAEKRALWDRAD